jgi:hypothetical protein
MFVLKKKKRSVLFRDRRRSEGSETALCDSRWSTRRGGWKEKASLRPNRCPRPTIEVTKGEGGHCPGTGHQRIGDRNDGPVAPYACVQWRRARLKEGKRDGETLDAVTALERLARARTRVSASEHG